MKNAIVSLREVCVQLGCSYKSLYWHLRTGNLPVREIRVGVQWFFAEKDVSTLKDWVALNSRQRRQVSKASTIIT